MLLTAHGGALGTGRNSQKYFDTIKDYDADIIEVDIHKRGKLLYISHMPKLFPKKAIPLSYVFEFIKMYDFRVNCDIKRGNLAKSVLALAKEMGVARRIIFTGAFNKKDLKNLIDGEVYLNKSFFAPLRPIKQDLEAIKAFIGSLNNDKVKGINISYKFCNEEMLDEAKRIGLALSIFTVDKIEVLERLMKHKEIANITSNKIGKALQLKEQ